jgi:hypothetical protein
MAQVYSLDTLGLRQPAHLSQTLGIIELVIPFPILASRLG